MIIISGVSSGIGRFLWNRFREENSDVIGLDKFVAEDLRDNSNVFCLDITQPSELNLWFEKVRPLLNKIVLINCAGINYNAFAHKSDLALWSNVIQVNLIGTFYMIHTVLPVMREQNWGRIINFASVVAQSGVPCTLR